VDDEPISRRAIVYAVEKEHLQSITAEDPNAAFKLLEEKKFDLVFLDLQLPKKDGYAILEEIRADPRLAPMRVVALTANVSRREVERCRAAGFDGFIGKPIDGRRFSALLRKILKGEAVWTEE